MITKRKLVAASMTKYIVSNKYQEILTRPHPIKQNRDYVRCPTINELRKTAYNKRVMAIERHKHTLTNWVYLVAHLA